MVEGQWDHSFTLLYFNAEKLCNYASLAGLQQHLPHLTFIQEVSQFSSLPVLVAAAYYSARLSTSL
jgi:hypothetical protein